MIELKPFQVAACEGVRQQARRGKRVIVLQSWMGTGKTYMGCDLARGAVQKGNKALIIAQRRKLVDNFSRSLGEFELRHGMFMRDRSFDFGAPIQVASVDTLYSRCVNNQWIDLPPAQLVIVDEGRHAIAPEFRSLLQNYEQQGATIVLLDATPVQPNGRGLGPWAQALVSAGKVSDLIRDGHILPVKVHAPDRKRGRGGRMKRGMGGDLVESWKKYAEGLPTVTFFSRIKHSQDATEAFREAGVEAVHLDGNTPDGVRDRYYAQLEDGTVQVICNVRTVNEGVDIPCLGCCQFFMDPASRAAFLQPCGRMMRVDGKKKYGILIDHAGAVFRYGFPDEDMNWPLNGDVSAVWDQQVKDGLAKKPLYCHFCEALFYDVPTCPLCGRYPIVPPKSVFDPPDIDHENELLPVHSRDRYFSVDEMRSHWIKCAIIAWHKHGTFKFAAALYARKYDQLPDSNFPFVPAPFAPEWGMKVRVVFPELGIRKKKGEVIHGKSEAQQP